MAELMDWRLLVMFWVFIGCMFGVSTAARNTSYLFTCSCFRDREPGLMAVCHSSTTCEPGTDSQKPSRAALCIGRANATNGSAEDIGQYTREHESDDATELRRNSASVSRTVGYGFETECVTVVYCLNSTTETPNLTAIDVNRFLSNVSANLRLLVLTQNNLYSIEETAFDELPASLKDVDLSRNNIRQLSWKALSKLERLNISYNLLRSIDCGGGEQKHCGVNYSLRILDLCDNLLTQIPILKEPTAAIPNLSVLNVSRNRLDRLTALPGSLVEFRASENELTYLENGIFASHLEHLRVIDLSRNKLSVIVNYTFVDLSAIQTINVSHNIIEAIEPSAFYSSPPRTRSSVKLDEFRDGEDVRDVANPCEGRTWSRLQTIDLSHNQLRNLDDAVFMGSLCGVRQLLLGYNRIGRLSRYILEQLRRLEVLDLQHNELTWLEVGTFTSPSLLRIDLSHNGLRKIISMTFLYLPTVTDIDLSYNEIGYLYRYAFYRICKDWNQRIHISLRGNRLQTDAVWKMLSLLQHQENSTCTIDADLRDNQVTHLMGIEAIQTLKAHINAGDLSRFAFWERLVVDVTSNPVECDCQLTDELNAISYITGTFNSSSGRKSFAAWTKLNCSQPPVFQGFSVSEFLAYSICPVQISYASCPNVCDCRFDIRGKGNRYINCSRRHLTAFPDFESIYFNAVDLSYNDLTEVPLDYFRSAGHVVYLDLSHNHLTTLPGDALLQLSSLKHLFLHQNDIRYLPAEISRLPHLKFLSIQGNPLACDCRHATLNLVSTKLRGAVSDFRHVRCADGRYLWRLNLTLDCSLGLPTLSGNSLMSPVHGVLLAVCVLAVASAVAVLILRRVRARASRRSRGTWRKIENQDELIKQDVFISYSDSDEAWVTGTLLEIIWNESSQYSVCLQMQQHQLEDYGSSLHLESDTIRRHIDNSKVTIVVLSRPFLKNVWAVDSYRSTVLEKLESQRHQFIFVYLEQVDVEEQDRDLHGFLPEDKTLKVADPLFAEKLIYHLPPPLKISRNGINTSDPSRGLLVELTDEISPEYHSQKY